MKKLSVLILLVLLTHTGFAEQTFSFGKSSDVKIKDLALSENAKVGSVELSRVSSGLRYKKIVFITANVYVGQIFSNAKVDKSSLQTFRASLLKEQPFAMTLSFLRNVGADKLSDGFKETLKENGVPIDKAPYSEFIEAVKKAGEMKEGESYAFTFNKPGNAFVFYVRGKEEFKLDSAANDILENFMMIWFGKAPDSGLESLQKDILK